MRNDIICSIKDLDVFFPIKSGLLQKTTGSNTLSAIVSIIAAIVIYSLTMLLTGGIEEEDLLHFPGGTRLAAAAKRLHLLRG